MENGVRVISVKKIDDIDNENLSLSRLPGGELNFNEILKTAYDEGNAGKILEVVRSYCIEQDVSVRGICWIDGDYISADDEILYLTPPESCSDSSEVAQNIITQVEKFKQKYF